MTGVGPQDQKTYSLRTGRKDNGSSIICKDKDFLGAFSKLRNVTVTLAVSVCPPVCTEPLAFHRMDFHGILYLTIF